MMKIWTHMPPTTFDQLWIHLLMFLMHWCWFTIRFPRMHFNGRWSEQALRYVKMWTRLIPRTQCTIFEPSQVERRWWYFSSQVQIGGRRWRKKSSLAVWSNRGQVCATCSAHVVYTWPICAFLYIIICAVIPEKILSFMQVKIKWFGMLLES